MTDPSLKTIHEAATALNVPVERLYRYVARGWLPGQKGADGRLRVDPAAFDAACAKAKASRDAGYAKAGKARRRSATKARGQTPPAAAPKAARAPLLAAATPDPEKLVDALFAEASPTSARKPERSADLFLWLGESLKRGVIDNDIAKLVVARKLQ